MKLVVGITMAMDIRREITLPWANTSSSKIELRPIYVAVCVREAIINSSSTYLVDSAITYGYSSLGVSSYIKLSARWLAYLVNPCITAVDPRPLTFGHAGISVVYR